MYSWVGGWVGEGRYLGANGGLEHKVEGKREGQGVASGGRGDAVFLKRGKRVGGWVGGWVERGERRRGEGGGGGDGLCVCLSWKGCSFRAQQSGLSQRQVFGFSRESLIIDTLRLSFHPPTHTPTNVHPPIPPIQPPTPSLLPETTHAAARACRHPPAAGRGGAPPAAHG